MVLLSTHDKADAVTLHTEGVDRNPKLNHTIHSLSKVTLHTEGVDRNSNR